MAETFEQLLSRLAKDQTLIDSVEEATKQGVVLPILSQLGWDCFNLHEVVPEFPVANGRVDYCLRINDKEVVFIEVKRLTEDLDRHEEQLLKYSFNHGVQIAVLTNGLLWWFYLPLMRGYWQQRKFFTIDIKQQESRIAAQYFVEYLSRDYIANGSAIEKAESLKKSREKKDKVDQTLPRAWQQLIEEADELLLDLLTEKVESLCGYRPDKNTVLVFIKDIYIAKPMKQETQVTKRPEQPHITSHTPTKSLKHKGAIIKIGNKTIKASTVRELYYKSLEYLYESKVIERVANHIPFATSKVRYLISNTPFHQRGNPFRVAVKYGTYFMEAHKNYDCATKQLKEFISVIGLNMDIIKLI